MICQCSETSSMRTEIHQETELSSVLRNLTLTVIQRPWRPHTHRCVVVEPLESVWRTVKDEQDVLESVVGIFIQPRRSRTIYYGSSIAWNRKIGCITPFNWTVFLANLLQFSTRVETSAASKGQ